ncbi:MAG TPA: hypothetical protein VGC26_00865 [Afipia sp.]
MKIICVLSIAAAISASLAAVPATAADLPATRPAYGYVPPADARVRVFAVPGCHLGLERFWDGYAWRSRSIQVCN